VGVPFGIDGAGRVFAQGGDALLRSKVLQLLLTAPGERVNLPDFGTRLRDLVFDPNNDILAAATEFAVTRALQRFLGYLIHVDTVRIASRDDELHVDISYLRKSDLSTERLRVGIPIPR
jgi:phage baseplate assembly protein W